jgi:two-component system OmpR family response regulator
MRILVVEDDASLNAQLKSALEDAGYVVDTAEDGEEGHFLGDTEPYDCVVLDIGLPLMDGISVLQRWRDDGRAMPVLILTARDRWSDKVSGIDAGADDYVTKPFHVEEVLARVRALIRRAAGHASSEIRCGPLVVDTKSSKAMVDGATLKLTSHEFRLLSYLGAPYRRGRVAHGTGRASLRPGFRPRFQHDRGVSSDGCARRLGHDLIETVRGLGYRMTAPDEQAG